MTQLLAESRRSRRAPQAPYKHWLRVLDDTGALSLEVPGEWGNVRGDGWHSENFPGFEGRIGPGVIASPDIAAWPSDGSVAGALVGLGPVAFLERYPPCVAAHRPSFVRASRVGNGDIDFGGHAGSFVEWEVSSPLHSWVCIAVAPPDRSHLLFVQLKFVGSADVQAADPMLMSIEVDDRADGDVGEPEYSAGDIRKLLTDALSDEELQDLCHDEYRPVYNDFSTGMSKPEKARRLTDYAARRHMLKAVADRVKQINPDMHQYWRRKLGS